jgi:hypothetical protein
MPWFVFVVPLVGIIDLTIAYLVATKIVPRKVAKSGEDVLKEVRHQGDVLNAQLTAALTAAVAAWQAAQAPDKKEPC